MQNGARHTAETVARAAYGRLVARIAARTRDIAAAEDALAQAFRIALETWPARGIPDRTEAWLLTVARREAGHAQRHSKVRSEAAATIAMLADEAGKREASAFPDERLKLLFVCAHPAIDPAARTPLMLQTVLGIDAARIAAAFVTTPSAMAQRLVRAKAKIRDAGIAFEIPEPGLLAGRLPDVLQAVYAAYGTGWDEAGQVPLADEAIFLARLLRMLLPGEPEIAGLLALFLHCEARKPARRSHDGAFVPLAEQDCTLWSVSMIYEAETLLSQAAQFQRFGRFQTEAAIQSVHAHRAQTGSTDLRALVLLHDLLAERAPTIGALVSRAAVHGDAFGPEAGLRALDELPGSQINEYQPYWAVRTHLLHRAGQNADAARARAIALSPDPAVREFLARISPRPSPSATRSPPAPPRTG